MMDTLKRETRLKGALSRLAAAALLLTATLIAGCGQITDKDRIVIAKLEDETIRRGDLRRLIYEMDDDKRPIIRNRGDLLRVLNKHIDDTILNDLAYALRTERKIDVPRLQAQALHFQRNPDDRQIYEVKSASEIQDRDLDISDGQLAAFKADIEFKIDDVEEELLRAAALDYLIGEALKFGQIEITDEEFQREYGLYKDRLFYFERIGFVGIRFMAAFATATEGAADARRRYDAGESFDDIFGIYVSINEQMAVSSMIENNPNLPRFKFFWDKASGAKVGDVIGPVFIPEYTLMEPMPDGTYKKQIQPAAHLFVKVTEYTPPRRKTWQEARRDLAPMILRRKIMKQLRQERGAEVYEDKLPDPGLYDTGSDDDLLNMDF